MIVIITALGSKLAMCATISKLAAKTDKKISIVTEFLYL